MSDEKKSICRVVHNKNYTVVNNHICKDNTISYKAKGIWLYAFSRPDDWQFYECDIVNNSNEGKDSIKSGLKELEEAGYLVKERRTNQKHQFIGWSYTFYEVPNEIKKMFPKAEKPYVGKTLDRENPPLLSTELLPSTEEQQQKDISPDGSVVAFQEMLKNTGLSTKDKASIMNYALKNKISQEDFANAINFVLAPDFHVNTTLTKSIMWALKEKPKLPEPVDEKKNKKLAEYAEQFLHSTGWNLEALNDNVLIFSKTPTNSNTFSVKYSDLMFKTRLDAILMQLNFKKRSQ